MNETPDTYVHGMAYAVETEEHQKMLEHYKTNVYAVEGIRVMIEGERISGRNFAWTADPMELSEEMWPLEEWKREVEEEMASHFRPVED